jgi:hypothetical protein
VGCGGAEPPTSAVIRPERCVPEWEGERKAAEKEDECAQIGHSPVRDTRFPAHRSVSGWVVDRGFRNANHPLAIVGQPIAICSPRGATS